MSWRDEARADRLARVHADAQRDEAAARIRIAERAAAAAQRREDDLERDVRRGRARDDRAKRRAARLAWLSGHAADLLFAPVIGVPAVLAWTAMAAYGRALYGPAGLILPAFSEGGMWVFAAANTITRRRHPERPTWHLMTGTWVFAAAGAALNFAHGLALAGHLAGPLSGAVMALVSAAGVTAHQLVTAGPRRSRADRRQARLDRAAARRALAVRQAAIRSAGAELDEDGAAWLVFEPGPVTLTRRGHLARPAAAPADPTSDLAALAAEIAAETGTLAGALAKPLAVPVRVPEAAPAVPEAHPQPRFPIGLELAGAVSPWPAPATPEPAVPGAGAPGPEDVPAVPEPPASLNGHGHAAAGRYSAELAAGDVPSIRRIRSEMRVGQPRAAEIQKYLSGLTPAGLSIAAIRAELREQPGDLDTTTTQEGGS